MTTPLGVYVGNPHGNDPAAMAVFESQLQQFVAAVGQAPSFMNAFVDATLDWSQWASNASWTAWSWKQSAIAKDMIPVVGVPMAKYSEWTSSVGAKPFNEIASGQHDDVFRGIVEAWRDQGFTKIYLRPGYEMNGTFMPWFVGYTTQDADAFKAAFARIADIAHAVAGIDVKIVWNPNMTNWSGIPTQDMYPGDAAVDVVGLDIYSPQYPIDYYDVTSGTVDRSFLEWTSNTANRMGYWDYGDITQWNRDGAAGAGFGLLDAIAFAKAHNKTFALPETGAGGDGTTNGPVDDGAFPTYLRDRLAAAGVTLEFANIWDATMGDGNWRFSDGSKPQEAAAWKAFAAWVTGLDPATPPEPPPPPPPVVNPPADATVINFDTPTLADGAEQPIAQGYGGFNWAQTGLHNPVAGSAYATASGANIAFFAEASGTEVTGYAGVAGSPMVIKRADGADFTFHGASFSGTAYGQLITAKAYDDGALVGTFTVTANRGSAPWVSFDSSTRFTSIDEIRLTSSGYFGMDNFAFSHVETTPVPPPITGVTVGTGADKLVLRVSEDAYLGDAQFTVAVDGKQVGGTLTATASHAAGQSTTVTVLGDWTAGAHTVTVTFLNDAWAGTASTDRNLYVDGASFNGVSLAGTPLALMSAGGKSLGFTDTTGLSTPTLPAPVYAKLLNGDSSANVLTGGTGADRLEGMAGKDTLTGGAGPDIFAFASKTGADVVTDFQSGVDKLVFQGFDAAQINVRSTTAGLVLTDGVSGDSVTLKGVTKLAAGDIVGAPAVLRGTTGADNLDRSAATGPARITALEGNDVLKGGAGDDWLFGNAGGDTMTGGGGRDGFVFAQGDGFDRVQDFTSGVDHLVMRGIAPTTLTASFSTQAGVAGIDIAYGTAGDHVFLAGVTALAAGDLIFT